MRRLTGFLITCILIPAVYAGLVYGYVVRYGQQASKSGPLTLAILIAIPLVVTGLPKWWDIWIAPSPKLGSPYRSYSRSEFLAYALKLNAIGIFAAIVLHLLFNQLVASEVLTTRLTLDVPKTEARIKQITALMAKAEETRPDHNLVNGEFGEYNMPADPWLVYTDENGQEDSVNINMLMMERTRLRHELREHEEKVKLLEATKKHPGDYLAPWALWVLGASALLFSLHNPINKKFHSGQPITQG